MSNYDLLKGKAIQICERCKANGLTQPQFSVVSEYRVNFIWLKEGKRHTLSLDYKPSRQRWTLTSNSDWLKSVICPLIQPLVDVPPSPIPSLSETHALKVQNVEPRQYFTQAQESVHILEPYANENVDCSIICELTKVAARAALSDVANISLNRPALMTAIDKPNSPDFFVAKEYFITCLTLCTSNNNNNPTN
jgi:hypothetical protein